MNPTHKPLQPDFTKYSEKLVPAIVQDAVSGKVLMLGYMNEKALEQTEKEGRVTFYSRSKKRLWTKGESSGNFLYVKDILADCDMDCLLIKAVPAGPVCHTGADTCFNEKNPGFSLEKLEDIIRDRKEHPDTQSYTASLLAKGINKVAQKLGEEAVELVIESKDNDPEKFLGEAADLLFHYMVLLRAKGFNLQEVVNTLSARHKPAH